MVILLTGSKRTSRWGKESVDEELIHWWLVQCELNNCIAVLLAIFMHLSVEVIYF